MPITTPQTGRAESSARLLYPTMPWSSVQSQSIAKAPKLSLTTRPSMETQGAFHENVPPELPPSIVPAAEPEIDIKVGPVEIDAKGRAAWWVLGLGIIGGVVTVAHRTATDRWWWEVPR